MEEWNEILNQISRKYQKAKQASIKKEVFKDVSYISIFGAGQNFQASSSNENGDTHL